jgi:hypothetical protein
MFKKYPTKNKLDIIIQNLKNILINKITRCNGINEQTVKPFYNNWKMNINSTNNELIIENFEEIIEHINIISTDIITEKVRDMYLEILDIYANKIKIIYNIQ